MRNQIDPFPLKITSGIQSNIFIWLKEAHPEVHEGKVTRLVCFHWSPNYCRWSVNIQVHNCSGCYLYFINGTHILGNGVDFVTVAPTQKELNTNSQALEGT